MFAKFKCSICESVQSLQGGAYLWVVVKFIGLFAIWAQTLDGYFRVVIKFKTFPE